MYEKVAAVGEVLEQILIAFGGVFVSGKKGRRIEKSIANEQIAQSCAGPTLTTPTLPKKSWLSSYRAIGIRSDKTSVRLIRVCWAKT